MVKTLEPLVEKLSKTVRIKDEADSKKFSEEEAYLALETNSYEVSDWCKDVPCQTCICVCEMPAYN